MQRRPRRRWPRRWRRARRPSRARRRRAGAASRRSAARGSPSARAPGRAAAPSAGSAASRARPGASRSRCAGSRSWCRWPSAASSSSASSSTVSAPRRASASATAHPDDAAADDRGVVHRRACYAAVSSRGARGEVGLVDERGDHARLAVGLGMPLDAEREAALGVLERLGQLVVVRPAGDARARRRRRRRPGGGARACRGCASPAARAASEPSARRTGWSLPSNVPRLRRWSWWPRCSGRSCTSVPPRATFITCMPRQMPRNGMSRSIARVASASSNSSRSGAALVGLGVRLLAVGGRVDVAPAGQDQAVEQRRACGRARPSAAGRARSITAMPPARLHGVHVAARAAAPHRRPRRRTARARARGRGRSRRGRPSFRHGIRPPRMCSVP